MRQGILFPGGSWFKQLVFKNRDRQNTEEKIKDKLIITLFFCSLHRREFYSLADPGLNNWFLKLHRSPKHRGENQR